MLSRGRKSSLRRDEISKKFLVKHLNRMPKKSNNLASQLLNREIHGSKHAKKNVIPAHMKKDILKKQDKVRNKKQIYEDLHYGYDVRKTKFVPNPFSSNTEKRYIQLDDSKKKEVAPKDKKKWKRKHKKMLAEEARLDELLDAANNRAPPPPLKRKTKSK
jgi:patatin-like phospholipase/acyl hydrolase